MEMPGGLSVLTTNGSTHQLPKAWLPDKSAWGLHEHMSFYFWLAADGSDIGSEVSATFSVYDAAGCTPRPIRSRWTSRSCPKPASLGMVLIGGLLAAPSASPIGDPGNSGGLAGHWYGKPAQLWRGNWIERYRVHSCTVEKLSH
jgi:hypothetical protein